MDCVAEDRRVFGITGRWSTAAPGSRVWYSIVDAGGCRFMAAWAREEEKESKHRQRKEMRARLRLRLE